MHISQGNVVKELTLYPPTKPTIQQEFLLWPGEKESDQADKTLQLYMIEKYMAVKQSTKPWSNQAAFDKFHPFFGFQGII